MDRQRVRPAQASAERGSARWAKYDAQFAELFQAAYPRLCRIAYRLVHDHGLAEQTVSQSLLKVWRRAASVDWNDPLPFACTIVIHECYRELRSSQRQGEIAARISALDLIPHQRTVSVDIAHGVTERAHVLDALAKLPLKQRAVVTLRVYEDFSEAEVARILEIGVGTVKSHYSRGLAALRATLSPAEVLDDA